MHGSRLGMHARVQLFELYMGSCGLHCEMRMLERVCTRMEQLPRERAASGSASEKAAIAAFNDELKKKLELRHGIHTNEKGEVKDASLDGRDSGRLRADLLKLQRVCTGSCTVVQNGVVKHLEARAANDAPGRLQPFSANGKYPSIYVRGLHTVLSACANSSTARDELAALAEDACRFARAMQALRASPEVMREWPGGPEAVYAEFETQSRLFMASWRTKIEASDSFKAYEFHLWANIPRLFRKWGCMGLMSQEGMEGSVGKLAQLIPRIATHPRGAYNKQKCEDDPGYREEEYQRRLAEQASPAQKVVEEFMMEASESRTEHLPNKQHDTRWSQKDMQLRIDDAIQKGEVITYAEWVAYCQRYQAATVARCRLRRLAFCSRVNRSNNGTEEDAISAREWLAKLKAEHDAYYEERRVSPACVAFVPWMKKVQRAAKKAYHEKARARRDERGRVTGGRQLAYQCEPARRRSRPEPEDMDTGN